MICSSGIKAGVWMHEPLRSLQFSCLWRCRNIHHQACIQQWHHLFWHLRCLRTSCQWGPCRQGILFYLFIYFLIHKYSESFSENYRLYFYIPAHQIFFKYILNCTANKIWNHVVLTYLVHHSREVLGLKVIFFLHSNMMLRFNAIFF